MLIIVTAQKKKKDLLIFITPRAIELFFLCVGYVFFLWFFQCKNQFSGFKKKEKLLFVAVDHTQNSDILRTNKT